MAIQKRLTKAGKTVYIARWRDPAGKEHSKSFTRQKEAKAHVQEMERDKRLHKYLPEADQDITVKEMFSRWMNDRPLRESSLIQYRYVRDRLLGPLGQWPARQVTPADVNEWANQLRTCRSWLAQDDKGIAGRSVQITLSWLRSAFTYGVDNDLVGKNPVRVPKKDSTVEPDEIPTLDEIQRVIDAVEQGGVEYMSVQPKGMPPLRCVYRPDRTMADMLRTAALTGMRISELCGLLVEEVDLEAGVIRVRKQLSRLTPRRRVELKSSHSRRDVPIARELAPVLKRVIGGRPEGYLFVNSSGGPVHANVAAQKVSRAGKAVGAERVHFHALRHRFASSLLTGGVPVQDVARVLGHTPATLLRTYTHVLDGSRERVAGVIDSALGCGISAGSPQLTVVRDGYGTPA
ncbi:tyrosine-type recombinase/integrase [Corynebacterium macginleyi]|uniref:tyrosine-type recombinase/integrase n=1 Tax=Corynebacterium macginleyi TaxID=38290 RepID=UPI00190BA352|nr:site-specific integrase [Corynebacterium macginleyi]MBK4145377.1 tyrosine-type recombinase/integrase [Corynebacterium macginleyi]